MSQSLGNPQHRQSRRTGGKKISYIVLEGELCLSLIITSRVRDLKIKHHISNTDIHATRILQRLHVSVHVFAVCDFDKHHVPILKHVNPLCSVLEKLKAVFDCHSPTCFSSKTKNWIHHYLFFLLEDDISAGSTSEGSSREANVECNERVPDMALRMARS